MMEILPVLFFVLLIKLFGYQATDLTTFNEDANQKKSMEDSKRLVLHSEEDLAFKIIQLESTVAKLQETSGSTYVRWGRNTCPGNAELVYKGYTAGKHYNTAGSGSDSLCLPEDPVWGKYHDGDEANTVYRGYIYGAEIDNEDIDQTVHEFPYIVNEQDMPCSVCKTNYSVNVMIPARNICYPGWTKEYSGYLMSASDKGHAYNHICMDGQPEFLQHGGTNDNQHILYLVEGRCGSLPCPPYVQGRELTCVVCSK